MPISTPSLDERSFQDFVDQAKRLIPTYCPEWTDHNVSDPGVALIELFSGMAEMLLHRVNRIPDRVYLRFIELMGMKQDAPKAAQAPITFYLSGAAHTTLTIPRGTVVSTVRTEARQAVSFSTEEELVLNPPGAITLLKKSRRLDDGPRYEALPVHAIDKGVPWFDEKAADADHVLIGFEESIASAVLLLRFDCVRGAPTGIQPDNPPWVWEALDRSQGEWLPCEIEHDGTGGLSRAGELVLHVPELARSTIGGVSAFWLRVRLVAQRPTNRYERPPVVRSIQAEVRGGTVSARHSQAVENEVLGRSDGSAGQRFTLKRAPVLSRVEHQDEEYLVVTPPGEEPQRWTEVPDFADSTEGDKHYTLNDITGEITFGPMALQKDGSVHVFGAIPPRGSIISFSRYRHGGGVEGNLPPGALCVLKSSLPYVRRVVNRKAAVGGFNASSLEDLKIRAPGILRARTRAVTEDDYIHFATRHAGVRRAGLLSPTHPKAAAEGVAPGLVVMTLLEEKAIALGPTPPAALRVSEKVVSTLRHDLMKRSLLGVLIDIRQPQGVWVQVDARVQAAAHVLPERISALREALLNLLYTYLCPQRGGPDGRGWPFGRSLHSSEIYALIQSHRDVEFVERLEMSVHFGAPDAPPKAVRHRVDIPPLALICSAEHVVSVAT